MKLLSEFPYRTDSPEQTVDLGRRLGTAARPGMIVALSGDLGSGKTQFAKGFFAGLGADPDQVSSPTFSLAHEYAGDLPLAHLDLYRVETEADFERAGLQEYVSGEWTCIIEWPRVAARFLPVETLLLLFRHDGGNSRLIDVGKMLPATSPAGVD